jgi:hypothetical protein
MNTAHWHLLLNHLPVVGTVIGTLILIAGFLLKNNHTIKQTALGVLVFSALTAIPAYLTGEEAEEIVEKLPGVSENMIEAHEDLSKIFLVLVLILGALSVITFLASHFKSKFSSVLFFIILIASIGIAVFSKQVGTSGGEIRHTEIRSDSSGQNVDATENRENDEADDD